MERLTPGTKSTSPVSANRHVAVFGAYGHTGRFVVAELRRRGWLPILAGRDAERLKELAADFQGLETRPASIENPESLRRALAGAAAVINCAGPFLDTGAPLLDCALRQRIHYLDLTAEQAAAQVAFGRHADASAAGVSVVPAMAFYGGFADLLATAALHDWPDADEIQVTVALDSWHPTLGTRLTGKRNNGPRLFVMKGALTPVANPPPMREWEFPAPFGRQHVVGLPFSEIVILSRHIQCPEVTTYINQAALRDIRDPKTPPPAPADASGRSAQRFVLDVQVRRDGETRGALAHGRDIYAISAPLVVEAFERIVTGRMLATGAVAPGEAFDARGFLLSLAGAYAGIELSI